MRAVQVFGFHLATVDLRQSSDKHEAVVAELLAVARIEPDYAALDEAARARRCCSTLLERCAPAARAAARRRTASSAQSELAIFEAAPRCCAASAATALRHYIISHTET